MDEELEKIQNKCLILSGILDGKTNRFEPDPTLEVVLRLSAHTNPARVHRNSRRTSARLSIESKRFSGKKRIRTAWINS